MPVVGAGFAGIPRLDALFHLLTTFNRAQGHSLQGLCTQLTVVIYHKEWEEGEWVRRAVTAASVLTEVRS